jgi:hypothetical protein
MKEFAEEVLKLWEVYGGDVKFIEKYNELCKKYNIELE